SKRIDDRIVSISQPHVRPIVRGKAKAGTEFGAKVSVSLVNGYALMENLDWDNYNEGTTLQESAERYKSRFGHYPEAILADQIYRNRENRQYCKEKGIRLSGPALGRPSKEKAQIQKQLAKQDAAERNEIEGKFGEGKRHYGMGLIFARLQQTSETVISIQLLVMNLERSVRLLFYYVLQPFFGNSVELKWAVCTSFSSPLLVHVFIRMEQLLDSTERNKIISFSGNTLQEKPNIKWTCSTFESHTQL